VVLLGKENVGKTQLAPSLAGCEAGLSFGDLIVHPRPSFLERSALGPLWALLLLLAPACAAVGAANRLANLIDPWVRTGAGSLAGSLTNWPQPLAEILAGDYGLLTMGPLLVVWATPVVVLHALLLGAYKASGLLDRLTIATSPWLRPFGMTGRELARVVMGFGCNVPAVVSARSSLPCSRGVCVSSIAFGSACSYQLGATLAVFAAAGRPELVVPYLLYLGATTLAYAGFVARQAARAPFDALLTERRVFLTWPRARAVWLEARGVVRDFIRGALPIFILITAAASLLRWLGALQAASTVVGPAMAVFRLPSEAALAVVLASVRKDGILLLAEPGVAASLDAVQLLTAVYLAGVLLPCLVTCLTIAREQGRAFALRLVGRQAAAAAGFSALLAWGGAWL
jgi:Fe2+ transport system protein B